MNSVDIKRLENKLIQPGVVIRRPNVKSTKDFREVLEDIQNKEEIKFSKHAIERLNSRDLKLNNEEMNKLKTAFKKAEIKGVKDALILMDDKAFIANIKNKVIVTTVTKEQLKDNIFTNIDGAVIV
ncbi:MAG: flagellar protein [Tissierellaceae bacterium]|nr:flagellar protein [Tissierellaceae bacterium]